MIDRKLLFVTGKGGTGKTTIAAAFARWAARSGKRVLLCELDRTGDIGAPFGVSETEIGFEPKEVEPGVFVMAMDTEAALQEYLRLNLKIPFTVRMGPFAKAFDFIATAAPGVREILTIGKLCWDVKRELYDMVIVDASASGHIVSQLASPDTIGELVSVGPLVSQTSWMRDILRDPQRTGVIVVTTPEEMPVSEAIELMARLKVETQTPIAAVAVNRVLPELFVRDEVPAFSYLQDGYLQDSSLQESGMGERSNKNISAVIDIARLAMQLRSTQVGHLDTLRAGIDQEIPLLFIPQSFGDGESSSVVAEAYKSLTAELDQ